jgi:DNA mismatch endonuclease, patch repair protein
LERVLRAKLRGGKFGAVSRAQSGRMRAIRGRGNRSTELTLRMALVRDGIVGWRMHDRNVPGCPDFYFERPPVAVFVDGCFWHGCRLCSHGFRKRADYWKAKIEGNHRRDIAIANRLRRSGVIVMRFWEHDLRSNLKACVAAVSQSIATRE